MSLEIFISHIRVWYFTVSFHRELCEEKNLLCLNNANTCPTYIFLYIIPHVITNRGNL